MKKTQREEIVEQILDLQYSRKSVNIDNMDVNGISFTENVAVQHEEVFTTTSILWDIVSYYQDLEDRMPSLGEFGNVDNLIHDNIGHTSEVCINKLTISNAIRFQRNVKYTTRVVSKFNASDRFTFRGKCKAVVYINDSAIIQHDYHQDGNLETVSSNFVNFSEGAPYLVTVIIYGYLSTESGGGISLESSNFTKLESSNIPDIQEPISLFASQNNTSGVELSWEQLPSNTLMGGGVELWARLTDPVDLPYLFLDRVSSTSQNYFHNTQSNNQTISSNNNFQAISVDTGETTYIPIPASEYTDNTGIIGWGVSYVGNSALFSVNNATTAIGDNTSYLQAVYDLNDVFYCNTLNSYDVNSNGTQENYTSNEEGYYTKLDYDTGSFYVDVSPESSGFSSTGVVTVLWENELNISDADVQIQVFRGIASNIDVVPATDTTYSFELDAAEMIQFNNNPHYLRVVITTGNALRNSAPLSSYILLKKVSISFGTIIEADSIFLKTNVSYNPRSNYFVDIICSPLQESTLYISGTVQGNTSGIAIPPVLVTEDNVIISTNSWSRYRVPITVPNASSFIGENPQMVISALFLKDTIGHSLSFNIQSISIIKSDGRPIPTGTEYEYLIRNYDRNLLYSDFIGPITGIVAPAVYNLELTKDFDNVSHFRKSKIYARATTSLDNIDVYVEDTLGVSGNVINLDIVASNENNADFTFEYKPFFANPIFYDTFNNDYLLHPDVLGGSNPNYVSLASSYQSAEDSPQRLSSSYSIGSSSALRISKSLINGIDSPWASAWLDGLYDKSFKITQWSSGTYKEYEYSPIVQFYQSLGNRYEYHSPFSVHNRSQLGFGFIFQFPTRTPQLAGESDGLLLVTAGTKFNLIYDNVNEKFNFYVGGDVVEPGELGAWRLEHEFLGDSNGQDQDWYLLNVSFDYNNITDINKSYISVYNITQDTSVTRGGWHGPVSTGSTSTEATYIPWSSVHNIKVGCVGGTKHNFEMNIDSIFANAQSFSYDSLINNIIPILSGGSVGNIGIPHYPSYGYKTGQTLSVYAEGHMPVSVDFDINQGSIVQSADTLLASTELVSDWYNPDGTMYILREAFTMDQEDIENLSALQNTYTYHKINKLFVNYSSSISEITHVRFTNDRTTWGEFVPFVNQIAYPWTLKELYEYPADTSEGGIREVWAQTITEVGNTSDHWLNLNMRDDIIYNPIGSLGSIESYNYVKGQSGWSIDLTGTGEFNELITRNRTINLGRNFNLLKMSEQNIGTQIDSEYNVHSKTVKDFVLSSTLGELGGYLVSGHVQYNNNIVMDIEDGNTLYIPIKPTAATSNILKYNMTEKTVDVVNPYTQNTPYTATICLTDKYAYVSSIGFIDKFDKKNIDYAGGVGTFGFFEMPHGIFVHTYSMKTAYNSNNELRIYIMVADPTAPLTVDYLYVIDEDLNLLQTVPLMTTRDNRTSNCFDINHKKFVMVFNGGNFGGQILVHTLDSNGLLGNGTQNPFTTIDQLRVHENTYINDLGEIRDGCVAAGQLSGSSLYFRYPSAVSILGDSAVIYTEAGVDLLNPAFVWQPNSSIGSYHMLAVQNLEEPGTSSGLNYLSFFSSVSSVTPEIVYPDRYTDCYVSLKSSMSGAQIADTMTEPYPIFKEVGDVLMNKVSPYLTISDGIRSQERGLGFTKPQLVNNKIYIGHTNSYIGVDAGRDAALYTYGYNGKSLTFLPDVILGYDSILLSTLYDGQYYIELKGKDNRLLLDISLI